MKYANFYIFQSAFHVWVIGKKLLSFSKHLN